MTDKPETRPVMYITYAYDDPWEAPVLDSCGTLREARRRRRELGYGVTYQLARQPDGTYGDEVFIEAEGQ